MAALYECNEAGEFGGAFVRESLPEAGVEVGHELGRAAGDDFELYRSIRAELAVLGHERCPIDTAIA